MPRWRREVRAWLADCRELRWRRILTGALVLAAVLTMSLAAGVWDKLFGTGPAAWESDTPAAAAAPDPLSKLTLSAAHPMGVPEVRAAVRPLAHARATRTPARATYRGRTPARAVHRHHYRHHARHHYRHHYRPQPKPAPKVAPAPHPRPVAAAAAKPRPTVERRPAPTPRPRVAAALAPPRPVVAAPAVPLRCGAAALAGTQPRVSAAGRTLMARFGIAEGNVLGRGARGTAGSDHPTGLALDFMVRTNAPLGNALAAYVLAHRAELGVAYVIWQQRINLGGGWTAMADRGSPTANHLDHVHVSFKSGGC